MIVWLALGLAILGVVSGPFLKEYMRPRMDEKTRTRAPGFFADLPKGKVHYQWLGAENGPVAVCVHGLSTPSFVWSAVAERLAQMGYRVLVYDLYGRGFSDRPKDAQDSAFFISQLDDLLAHLEVERDITLIGYSMGGAIAAAYAAERPERLRQVCLIAPAGIGHDLGSLAELIVKYDWFGAWVAYAVYPSSMRQGLEADRNIVSAIPNIYDLQKEETYRRGFAPAMLSSLRGILDEDLEPAHRAIAAADVPVLAIWGRDDDVIPISGVGKLAEWNRDAKQEVIEDADHTLTYTRVDDVAKALARLKL